MATDKNGKKLKVGDRVLVECEGHVHHGCVGRISEILEGDKGPLAWVVVARKRHIHAPDLRLTKIAK